MAMKAQVGRGMLGEGKGPKREEVVFLGATKITRVLVK